MEKEKAIRLLRDAHKHREYAEKLERIAHRQIEDGRKDEHEVRASDSTDSIYHDSHDRHHALLGALHRAVGTHLRRTGGSPSAATRHLNTAAKHEHAANFSRPTNAMSRAAHYKVKRTVGIPGDHGFSVDKAKSAIAKTNDSLKSLKESFGKTGVKDTRAAHPARVGRDMHMHEAHKHARIAALHSAIAPHVPSSRGFSSKPGSSEDHRKKSADHRDTASDHLDAAGTHVLHNEALHRKHEQHASRVVGDGSKANIKKALHEINHLKSI